MTQPKTRDFTKKRPPVFFTIGDDRFNCYKALDFDQLRKFASLAQSVRSLTVAGDDENADVAEAAQNATETIEKIMKIVMKKASFITFSELLHPSEEVRESDDFEPIDPFQFVDIVKWLMEVYTNRPSQPSPSSSTTSSPDDGGSSSTDGALLTAMNLDPSEQMTR